MKLACITLALALLAPTAHAQFGGVKVPGMGPVTVESLMGDINSGTDYFGKAAKKYEEALKAAGAVLENNASAETTGGKPGAGAMAFTAAAADRYKTAADELVKKGVVLSDEAKKLVSDGNGEMGKGIAKWGLLGVAIAKAKKDGAKDEKLVTALVAAEQAVKDLPKVKAMYEAMQALNKAKANAKS